MNQFCFREMCAKTIVIGLGALSLLAFAGNASAQSWSKVLDGVEVTDYDGIQAARIEIDLIGVSITPKVSQKGEPSPPKPWAQKHGLEVAINANFFSMSTMQDPCSIAVSNGTQWGSGWSPNTYASIGFTIDNRLKTITQAEETSTPAWAYNVVSGSPEIVRDGVKLSVASTQACKDLGHCSQSAYRSGIAYDKDKKYLILAVTKSGMTVENFALKLISLGAYYAINLDGGGSSGLYVNGSYYGAKSTRNDAVNLGFKVNPKPDYICKVAEIDNPSSVFYDMAADHWGLKAAKALLDNNITKGCGGQEGRPLFCPDCGLKRVQAAVFIARALNLPLTSPSAPTFSDVTADSVGTEAWQAVEACLAKGIISTDTKFRPNDVLTRAEGAAMLSRAFPDAIGGSVDLYADAPTPTFTDVAKDFWGYKNIEAMARNCFISGVGDNKFDPGGLMSRIQFAAVLARIMGFDSTTCAFTKQCDKLGNTSCSGNQLQTCTAYELVSFDCPDKCSNGSCVASECSGDAAVCEGGGVKICQDGLYVVQPCPSSLCEGGQCVECLASMAPTCNGNDGVYCVDGHLATNPCNSNETCQNGVCLLDVKCNDGEMACSGTFIRACKGGQWENTFDCNTDNKYCENGACISKESCTNGAVICDEWFARQTCINGIWTPYPCDAGYHCVNSQCVEVSGPGPEEPEVPGGDPENPGQNPGGDPENPGQNPGGDPENPGQNPGSDPDNPGEQPGEPGGDTPSNPGTQIMTSEGCSHSSGSGHPFSFAALMLAIAGALGLRRRRWFN
ncbi:MAG: phosphodiester glycosidase family protein [Proteobacteria bacterium]|nr:phosphodiester glycosidase family protein [Pseudomonadota bacterium]